MQINQGARQRFFAKFTRGEGCWEWTGATGQHGYGQLRIAGRLHTAPRIMFYLTRGYLPACVCHRCDNPGCVNPTHLFGGTHSDNMRDCVRKGRHHWTARTHCPRGHEYGQENTRQTKHQRVCRQCVLDNYEKTKTATNQARRNRYATDSKYRQDQKDRANAYYRRKVVA